MNPPIPPIWVAKSTFQTIKKATPISFSKTSLMSSALKHKENSSTLVKISKQPSKKKMLTWTYKPYMKRKLPEPEKLKKYPETLIKY